jgi:NADH-quinone oxidoreductase subunit L
MFVALGMGAHTTAVFHVITHAFFKALLFLGSGSVIHGMGGEQDIRRMGGLKKYMPTTEKTFLIGTLAIAGIFPFAGFFSKDQILAHAFEHNKIIFALLVFAAACTAFYMFRLYFLTFHGKFRGTHEQEHHLHESPSSMTIPLWILAILSIVGGFMGIPHAIGHSFHLPHALDNWLSNHNIGDPVIAAVSELNVAMEIVLGLGTMLISILMIAWAHNIYVKKNTPVLEDHEIKDGMHVLLYKKYKFDELYDSIIRKPIDALGQIFKVAFENAIIDGLVEGMGSLSTWVGKGAQLLHSGRIAYYLLTFIVGLLALISLMF